MATLALDWDDTLVDRETQEWLPGALNFVRALVMAKHHVFVHSSRANSPQGIALIERKLWEARLPALRVLPKPAADLYVDNQAHAFSGDFEPLYRHPALAKH